MDIGTFSSILDSAPSLYTSCNKLSESIEKCSCGKPIEPASSVVPIPRRKSRKSD